MSEAYLNLSPKDRKDAIGRAATVSGRPGHILEKDVWVVWALAALFESPLAANLVFKGGTSLSKAYGAIDRFSEDIDITYDIRKLIPELVGDAKDALPKTPSQEEKWTKAIRERLPEWAVQEALPLIQSRLAQGNLSAKAIAKGDSIYLSYDAAAAGYGYVKPEIEIEFGARSTGEPYEVKPVVCDAAEHLPGLEFPRASSRVMRIQRTFWEKGTAIHVYSVGGRLPGKPISRHWYDVARLDKVGVVDAALKDRNLALSVARHKQLFFPFKDGKGQQGDYTAAVSGSLHLVPTGPARDVLRKDYEDMVAGGLIYSEPADFDQLMKQCSAIETRANEAAKA